MYGRYLRKAVLYDYDGKQYEAVTKNFRGNGLVSPQRVFSMFYHISGVADLALASGISYEKIIILRPDLAFYADIDLKKIQDEKVHIPFGGDS